jgi:hypothetical protein
MPHRAGPDAPLHRNQSQATAAEPPAAEQGAAPATTHHAPLGERRGLDPAQLIATLDAPLNLEGNSRNAFHAELTEVRRLAVAAANELPVVLNRRVGGR